MNINFDGAMLAKLAGYTSRPKLLLHVCCAPCAGPVLERLANLANITLFYYNPNIHPAGEFEKRGEQIFRLLKLTGADYPLIRPGYDPDEFFSAVRGTEDLPEGGERCRRCFALRLKAAARAAAEGGYDLFTTTLSVSPHKNAAVLNAEGAAAGEEYGAEFLPADFKKKNGYLRSGQISRELGLYRQNYCGCVYSLKAEEKRPGLPSDPAL